MIKLIGLYYLVQKNIRRIEKTCKLTVIWLYYQIAIILGITLCDNMKE